MIAHAQHAASAQADRIGQPRVAIVSAVDPVAHAVKVMLQPEGIESGWLPDNAMAAGSLRIASPTEIGTQVIVAAVSGNAEELVITARTYDTVVQTPISPVTNKPAQPGELLVMGGQPAPPTTDGGALGAAAANPAWYYLTPAAFFAGAGDARLTITNGMIALSVGGISLKISLGGIETAGGPVMNDTDVVAKAVSLVMHEHRNVQPGSGVSGPPLGA